MLWSLAPDVPPLVLGMTNGGVGTKEMVVAWVFIGAYLRVGERKAMHMRFDGSSSRIAGHADVHLACFSPNRANERRAVMGIGPSSTTIVCALARWISRVKGFFPFFPHILKHLVSFSRLVWEGGIGLMKSSIVL